MHHGTPRYIRVLIIATKKYVPELLPTLETNQGLEMKKGQTFVPVEELTKSLSTKSHLLGRREIVLVFFYQLNEIKHSTYQ